MTKLPLLRDLNDLANRKVLLRLDLNVSVKHGEIVEDFRIKRILPTLNFLVSSGAKVIIISHIDEKEGGTLEPIAKYLMPTFPRLRFVEDIYTPEARAECDNLSSGGVILFENLRKWPGEEDNNVAFAKYLASFADIFVNEAFSVSHREHASIVGIPTILPSYIGYLFEDEIRNLSEVFHPEHPFLFILGGAKFETKIPLLNKFVTEADHIFIGGAIANDFFKAKSYFLGDSLVSKENIPMNDFIHSEKIILPNDVRTQHKGFKYVKQPSQISVNEKIYDVGPESISGLSKIIKSAKMIVWNGPLGNIEAGAVSGTRELAKLLTSSKAKTIIGGGDTIQTLRNTEFFSKFYFVSTGGGAMLQFLATSKLPGIDVVMERAKLNPPKKSKSWFKRFF